MRDPLDLPATPARLRPAITATGGDEPALRRALSLADASPPAHEWRQFVASALLLLGAGLVLSGVVSFFAFNWASLDRVAKFGLLQAAIAACAGAGWWARDTIASRVALFAAAVLIGPLLGVYGQTYQTGADPWGLFAAWALLAVPWTIAACFTPLWLLMIALVDLAVFLYWVQVRDSAHWSGAFLIAAVLHAASVAAWEWQRSGANPWLTEAWGPRLVAATTGALLLVPAIAFVYAGHGASGPLALAMLAAAASSAVVYYRSYRSDLFMLTAVAGSVLVLVAVAASRLIFETLDLRVSGLLLMAALVVGEVALVVRWLRRTLQAWRTT